MTCFVEKQKERAWQGYSRSSAPVPGQRTPPDPGAVTLGRSACLPGLQWGFSSLRGCERICTQSRAGRQATEEVSLTSSLALHVLASSCEALSDPPCVA